MTKRTHLMHPHGREAGSAGWAARHEERAVVTPLKRQVTQQRARRVASRKGLVAHARNALLRALPMTTGVGCGSRLASERVRPNAAHEDA